MVIRPEIAPSALQRSDNDEGGVDFDRKFPVDVYSVSPEGNCVIKVFIVPCLLRYQRVNDARCRYIIKPDM